MRRLPLLLVAAVLAARTLSAQWAIQPSGVTARFRGVSAVSDRVVWASGSNGAVVRTIDGGASWQLRPVAAAEKLDFRDVDAMSESVAYILSIGPGEASRIYKTIDGGGTWTLQFANTDPNVFLDAMTFETERHGYAFGDSVVGKFFILETRNGGQSWNRIAADRLPPALKGEGAFAASGTNVAIHGSDRVWIGTTASRVLRTLDGGRTWSVVQTPLPHNESTGIFSIAFRDATNGVIVGGDYRKERDAVDNVAFTSDGGATWTGVKEHGLTGFRSVVAWVPGTKESLIAVGPAGADMSTDGGRTWSLFECEGFHAFSFVPRKAIGWGAGERGRLSRLTISAVIN